jgi:trk system potassium uptake protein
LSDQSVRPLFHRPTRWVWFASAVVGGTALTLTYGFEEPAAQDSTIRVMLIVAAGLFLLSRLLMLFPLATLGERFARCWMDFAVLVAGTLWWVLDHSKEHPILQVFSLYVILTGAWSATWGGLYWLTDDAETVGGSRPVRRMFSAVFVLAVIGGLVLAVPYCWSREYPVSTQASYPGEIRYQFGTHALNCLLAATSALTGTGLTDLNSDFSFSRTGYVVLLVLMQIGGLAVLAVGTVVGLRLRRMLGWQKAEEESTGRGQRRIIGFVCLLMVVLELVGAGAIYYNDPNRQKPDVSWKDCLLPAAFQSVSGFCNVGLSITSDQLLGVSRSDSGGIPESLIGVRNRAYPYAVLLPLMVLGSIGGPTLHALFRRLRRRGTSIPVDAWLTLGATVLLIALGAGLLYAIESTPRLQLRYPQEDTLARLHTQPNGGGLVFSPAASQEAQSQRLRTMLPGERLKAALFQSVSARSCGMRTVRLDELSLSPAGRVVLIGLMLIGGSVGGTAGGLRLCVCGLLVLAVLRPRRAFWQANESASSSDIRPALAAAGGVGACLAFLILVTALVLTYRQAESFEACGFESVIACTGTGFSTGVTRKLLGEDLVAGPVALRVLSRSVLILAMMLGRVLPLGVLLWWTRRSDT